MIVRNKDNSSLIKKINYMYRIITQIYRYDIILLFGKIWVIQLK